MWNTNERRLVCRPACLRASCPSGGPTVGLELELEIVVPLSEPDCATMTDANPVPLETASRASDSAHSIIIAIPKATALARPPRCLAMGRL